MDTARFRRLASAASLIVAPALLALATAVLPWPDEDTLTTLRRIADDVGGTQAGDLLAFLGLLALVPATLALMRVLARRAPLLGLIGGCLMIAGAVGGMLLVVSDQMAIAFADRPDLQAQAATALDDSSAWVQYVVLVAFLGGMMLGSLVLGAGFLRGRILSPWVGGALIVSPVMSFVAHSFVDSQALDVASSVVLLIGLAPLARAVAATSDATWERGGLDGADAHPAPAATTA
jgi:hypothetical protein